MKKTLLLTLSAAALLAFTVPAFAVSETKPEVPAETASPVAEVPAGETSSETTAPSAPETDRAITEEAHAETEHAGVDSSSEDHAASHAAIEYPKVDWTFDSPTGTFDRHALQRGFQVYKQVCAACHSMNRLSYRNLAALGYSEGEIKAFAAEATVTDGPDDEGNMFERPGRPADNFKAPFANENAARYANNGALPPDLSLITRARSDGANYVHALLTGFADAPAGVTVNPGMYYNKYFAGHQIAMAPPLVEGGLTYDDGTEASIDQMAKDVSTFLTWAGEPTMEVRKQIGIKVLIFLLVFSGLMYLTKRKIWKEMH